ncbi:MAG: iron-containing alcohol dehydrogenase [Ruminococcaceae bacterium]|nr:iron-containing alcohol dehydrogenase [Oscillospiraceae bacterium]
MKKFFLPVDVRFGEGAVNLLEKIVGPDDRVFVVTDPGLVAAGISGRVTAILDRTGCAFTVYSDVTPNPTSDLVASSMEVLRGYQPTKVIAVGGGSPTDLGKILSALATNSRPLADYQWNGFDFEAPSLPFIAIPTTAGTGSEVTRCAVIGDKGVKKGINSDKLFAAYAIIDPELMTGLPPYLTATTGMDALTHAIEAFTGLGSSPVTDAWAKEAISLIGKSLWTACADGSNVKARTDMALASMLAGVAMDQAGLGMVHAMSGPLCTHYHLAHGEANALLLEYVMRFNLMSCAKKYRTVAELLGCDTTGLSDFEGGALAVEAVSRLFAETGCPVDLKKYGVTADAADTIAEGTYKMYMIANNPRKPSTAQCRQVFLEMLAHNQ